MEEDGRVQVLDAGGKELEEGRRLPASERGFRQRDMEAEPGFSAEALLSGGLSVRGTRCLCERSTEAMK